jgi:predicted TPR repeat methyltransferase
LFKPDFLAACLKLAHSNIQLGALEDARSAYSKVLDLDPNNSSAAHNLAILLIQEGKFDEALPLLEQSLAQAGSDPEGEYHLGLILASQGKIQEAREAYERALALNPQHERSAHNLAQVLLSLGDKAKAAFFFNKALKINPKNTTAKHMLAALDALAYDIAAPERAETGFVLSLFEQYAPSYNLHLTKTLNYQAPKLLREALTAYIHNGGLEILDLGCGTGLCAPYFSDLATRLYGIDLSPKMLAHAKQLGAYYRLLEGDILTELDRFDSEFDLIIAADVLVYFGELTELFRKISNALKVGAFFAFSSEQTIDQPYFCHPERSEGSPDLAGDPSTSLRMTLNKGYKLENSGRYSHAAQYLEHCAQATGLKLVLLKEESLRTQENLTVHGWIGICEKIV